MQKGFAQYLIVLLIAIGIGLGVFLIQKQTQLFPQAATPSPSPSSSLPPIKIMPLGDSITWGVRAGACCLGADPDLAGYRYYLHKSLSIAGLSPDFVGSLQSGPADLIDKDHEGHNGWGIGLYSDKSLSAVYENIDSWMDAQNPDVILMMLGINDLAQPLLAIDIPTAPQRLGMLIDKIFAKKPSVYLFAATIPPADVITPTIVEDVRVFNTAAVSVINSKRGPGRKLELVDVYANLTMADISDHVHPNEAGYLKVANLFYQAVINNLPSGYNLNKPTINIAQNQIGKGGSVTVSWNNVVYPFGTDFIGLYIPGSVDEHNYKDFRFTSTCAKDTISAQASTPKSSGSCDFPIDQLGQYEFRLFSQGSYLKLATSTIVNVVDSTPTPSPSPLSSPSPSPSVAVSPSASPSPSVSVSPSPSPSPSPKPGDIDGNGKVNIFDFSLFLSDFGKKGQNLKADFNNNGRVDIFDFSIMLSNWG